MKTCMWRKYSAQSNAHSTLWMISSHRDFAPSRDEVIACLVGVTLCTLYDILAISILDFFIPILDISILLLLPFRVAETSTPGYTAMEGDNVPSISTQAQLLERCVCIVCGDPRYNQCSCANGYSKGLINFDITMPICLVCRLCRN